MIPIFNVFAFFLAGLPASPRQVGFVASSSTLFDSPNTTNVPTTTQLSKCPVLTHIPPNNFVDLKTAWFLAERGLNNTWDVPYHATIVWSLL